MCYLLDRSAANTRLRSSCGATSLRFLICRRVSECLLQEREREREAPGSLEDGRDAPGVGGKDAFTRCVAVLPAAPDSPLISDSCCSSRCQAPFSLLWTFAAVVFTQRALESADPFVFLPPVNLSD